MRWCAESQDGSLVQLPPGPRGRWVSLRYLEVPKVMEAVVNSPVPTRAETPSDLVLVH